MDRQRSLQPCLFHPEFRAEALWVWVSQSWLCTGITCRRLQNPRPRDSHQAGVGRSPGICVFKNLPCDFEGNYD